MRYQASLRVVNPQGGDPTVPQMEAVSMRLSELGIQVVDIGQSGIAFSATGDEFRDVFGVAPPGPDGYSVPVSCPDAMLNLAVDRLEAYPPLDMF